MADTKDAPLTLRLLTPTGTRSEIRCDSVQLTLRDNAQGKGGGSVGIRRGHMSSVMALGTGPARASLHGQRVFSAEVDGGFASVRNDEIVIITDSAVIAGEDPTEED